MTPWERVLFPMVIIALVTVGAQSLRARTAVATSGRALACLTAVQDQAADIARLGRQTPGWARRAGPTLAAGGGIATAVSECLASCGIPSAALSSLSPAAQTPALASEVGGLSASRRRAVITLEPVTLPLAGRFLATWRDAYPEWTIALIDITPGPAARREAALPAPGTDLPLRAVISIESLFLDKPIAGTPAAAGAPR